MNSTNAIVRYQMAAAESARPSGTSRKDSLAQKMHAGDQIHVLAPLPTISARKPAGVFWLFAPP